MDRINGANTVDIGSGRRGFRAQNKASGLAGTEMTAAWFNAVQEELLAVIEGAGLDPAEATWTQLREAIEYMIANAVPEADLSPYLQKAGGTMTGSLFLDHAPVEDMEAVNKGYLDGLFGGDTSVALYIVRVFGGSANGLAGDPRPTAPTDLTTGDLVIGQLAASNTSTAVTVQLGTGTIYAVRLADGTSLPPVGSLIGGHLVLFRFDGTRLRALFDFTAGGPIPAGSSLPAWTVLADATGTGTLTLTDLGVYREIELVATLGGTATIKASADNGATWPYTLCALSGDVVSGDLHVAVRKATTRSLANWSAYCVLTEDLGEAFSGVEIVGAAINAVQISRSGSTAVLVMGR